MNEIKNDKILPNPTTEPSIQPTVTPDRTVQPKVTPKQDDGNKKLLTEEETGK